MKSQMIVQLNYKQMLSGGEMRTGTILRSIDFVNQSPWYIITWLYDGASAALAAWYLWQLMTFLRAPRRLRGSHNACAPRLCCLLSVVPAKTSELANLDHLCSRLKKLVSACCVLIRFQHYFPPTRFPPPPTFPPTFSPSGKGRWVAG